MIAPKHTHTHTKDDGGGLIGDLGRVSRPDAECVCALTSIATMSWSDPPTSRVDLIALEPKDTAQAKVHR